MDGWMPDERATRWVRGHAHGRSVGRLQCVYFGVGVLNFKIYDGVMEAT